MEHVGWFILSAIGAVVDSVFVLTPYHVKHRLSRHNLIILSLTFATLLIMFLPNNISPLIIATACIVIPRIIEQKRINIFYFLIPFIFLGVIQTLLTFLIPFGLFFFIATWFIQVFLILALYEDESYKFEFKLLRISVKVVGLLMVLMLF